MSFQHLSIDALKTLMIQDSELTIFDTRDPASYENGHIEQALSLNNDTMQQLLDDTPMSNTVVVCCYHGVSSQSVADWLGDQGFDTVYSLIGGYSAWAAQTSS
jgi:thiosulfate sulfurtransferase